MMLSKYLEYILNASKALLNESVSAACDPSSRLVFDFLSSTCLGSTLYSSITCLDAGQCIEFCIPQTYAGVNEGLTSRWNHGLHVQSGTVNSFSH